MVQYTLTVRKIESTDPRLGRHVLHDSRSLAYQVKPRNLDTLKSVRHQIKIPTLNQGNLGSCTGNAGTHNQGSVDLWGTGSTVLSKTDTDANEDFAVKLYSEATALDPWPGTYPPDDTGSDGLSIAKALKARGLISGYQHALGLNATLTALADRPVMVGTKWLNNMYYPDSTGKLDVSGNVAGGHEYLLDELDVENKRVWMRNSWGSGWGQGGRAWMTWDDLGKLLDDQGDCTVLVSVSQPPPTPTPVDPSVDDDAAFCAALIRLLRRVRLPKYFREKALAWLAKHGKVAS